MYYFCSPVKASIKSIKPFQHVILTGSCSCPLAFSLLKAGVWWWGLGTLNLHILSACLFLNGSRGRGLHPFWHLSRPDCSLSSHWIHISPPAWTGAAPPAGGTAVFENKVLPPLVDPSPRHEATRRDRYSRTHAILQRDIGAYPNVINGNFPRTSFSYNSLKHNLEAGRKSARVNWASWCKQCKDFQFSVNCSLKSVCVCVRMCTHAHAPYCTWYTSVDHMALVLEISI